MWNDHVFRLDVCDKALASLPVEQIYAHLLAIGAEAQRRPTGAPVGLLTTAQRDDAAALRTTLMHNATNAKSLDDIETSMFVSSCFAISRLEHHDYCTGCIIRFSCTADAE
jgi:hypothetical protein